MAREGTGQMAGPMVNACKCGECGLATLGGLKASISVKVNPIDDITKSTVRG